MRRRVEASGAAAAVRSRAEARVAEQDKERPQAAQVPGGTVEVTSQGLGHGSEFTVRLPLVVPPAVPVTVPASMPAPAPRRVLIIEDNVDAADGMRDLLELDGHDARVAYDGMSGLELAREFRPQIVFCDIGLPGMDGYEVARAMRADAELGRAHIRSGPRGTRRGSRTLRAGGVRPSPGEASVSPRDRARPGRSAPVDVALEAKPISGGGRGSRAQAQADGALWVRAVHAGRPCDPTSRWPRRCPRRSRRMHAS
jgi:CheY-like chemotaxis protein